VSPPPKLLPVSPLPKLTEQSLPAPTVSGGFQKLGVLVGFKNKFVVLAAALVFVFAAAEASVIE